jgi:ParB family chromosome partitioning protein
VGKKGLGKGLDALFADNATDLEMGAQVKLRITEIEPNRGQPRKQFDETALTALAESIREHGILQPLVVRPIQGSGTYQLVAGERRWRAARMVGLSEVPVVIKELDDKEAMEISLIENLQREDLNPIEEAEGYQTLMDYFGMTQDVVSQRVGKSRPAVANSLRLLGLPANVLNLVKSGDLSAGHARALLTSDDIKHMEDLAHEIVSKGLTVRAVEKLLRPANPKAKISEAGKSQNVAAYEIERSLSERLGRKVKVIMGKNSGVLEIEFYGEEDLKQLSRIIYNERMPDTEK